ncbi:MAG: hypothetical protein QW035_03930 [Candidatus Anstonellales archaeon]
MSVKIIENEQNQKRRSLFKGEGLIDEEKHSLLAKLKSELDSYITVEGFRQLLLKFGGNNSEAKDFLRQKITQLVQELVKESKYTDNKFAMKITLERVIESLLEDSFMLLKVGLTVYNDKRFEGKKDEAIHELEVCVQKAFDCTVSFFSDYYMLGQEKLIKDSVAQFLLEINPKILEGTVNEIKRGKYDGFIESICKQIKNHMKKESYLILNYHKGSFSRAIAGAILAADIIKSNNIKYPPEAVEAQIVKEFNNPALVFFPSITDTKYGLVPYLEFLVMKFFSINEKPSEVKRNLSEALHSIISLEEGIPKRDLEWVVEKLGGLEGLLDSLPMVNRDMVERVKKGEIGASKDEFLNYLFNEMKSNKGLSVFPEVVNSFLYTVPDNDIRDFLDAKGCRVIDLGINTGTSRLPAQKHGLSLFLGTDISYLFPKYQHMLSYTIDLKAPAATNNRNIFIKPFLTFFNTEEMNSLLFFKFMRHEVGHIEEGSFIFDISAEPRVDLFATQKMFNDMFTPERVERLRKLESFINLVIRKATEEVDSKFNLSKRNKKEVIMEDIAKTLMDVMLKTGKEMYGNDIKKWDEDIKSFVFLFPQIGFEYLLNVFEDYKIDAAFTQSDGPDEVIQALGEMPNDSIENFRAAYRMGVYTLLWAAHKERAEDLRKQIEDASKQKLKGDELVKGSKEEGGKIISPAEEDSLTELMALTLLKTKLGPLYPMFFHSNNPETAIFVEELDRLMRYLVPVDSKGVPIKGPGGIEKSMNRALEASMEYLALAVVFRDVKVEIIELYSEGEEEDEGGEEFEGGDGVRRKGRGGSPANKKSPKDGKGERGKEVNKMEKESDEAHEKAPVHPKKTDKRGRSDTEEKEREDAKEQNFKIKEKQKMPYDQLIEKEIVDKYINLLSRIKEGEFTVVPEVGKKGNVNIRKFVESVYSGDIKGLERSFERKLIQTSEKGSELRIRPINIYLVIDTSGSMSDPEREEVAKKHALALIAAQKILSKGKKDTLVKVRLISVASDDTLVDIDATEFTVEKSPSDPSMVRVFYDFESTGGGTDIPGMLRNFQKRMEEIQDEVVAHLWKKELAVAPSILFVFFTDFGDNAGDIKGIIKQLKELRKYAKVYREKTRNVKGPQYQDAGLVAMLVSPTYNLDSSEAKIKEGLSPIIKTYTSPWNEKGAEEIVNGINEALPILMGISKRASNIKEDEEIEE